MSAPIPLPDLTLNTSTTATGQSRSDWNSSGFVVNFGNGNSTAAGASPAAGALGSIPWVYVAAAVVGGLLLAKVGR